MISTGDPLEPFLRGIKATAYRFIAFKELTEEMNLKWEALELFPSHRDIFEQERDLLYLFVNGISAIESAYYSLYILATQANPKVLQFSDLENRKYGSDPWVFGIFLLKFHIVIWLYKSWRKPY